MTSAREKKGRDGLVRGADAKESELYPKDSEKPTEDFKFQFPPLYKMRDWTR